MLGPAARFLEAFKDDVNAHSDGWPYWKQPGHAVERLMGLLNAHLHGGMGAYPRMPEPIAADVLATLPPIKLVYTRLGTTAGITLPELKFGADALPPSRAHADVEAEEPAIRAEIARLEAIRTRPRRIRRDSRR